jgi:hypothetical protein
MPSWKAWVMGPRGLLKEGAESKREGRLELENVL